MSVSIALVNLLKKYNEMVAIPDLTLDIRQGEFFTLLGPSGCGKTTLLRMIAGFNTVEGGEIRFNDTVINDVSPQHRNIGMVFQNYAIFPQMTVAKNVAFGLTNRKVPKDQITARVDHVLHLVHISQLRDRLPGNMSGGQQQRVALARAIVIEPDVMLMDEPLSNLDAKLRVEMREAIKEIQHSVGITTVYVTHDQEEAMAVSDRIAVMKEGRIQHAGTPTNIYHRPANTFVADFIGKTNMIERPVVTSNGRIRVQLNSGYSVDATELIDPAALSGDVVTVSIRPEALVAAEGAGQITAEVIKGVFLGSSVHYTVRTESGDELEFIDSSQLGGLRAPSSRICLDAEVSRLNFFDAATGRSVTRGVVNDAAAG